MLCPPRPGVSLAALSLGVLSLVLAVSTWAAWVFLRPEVQTHPMNRHWPVGVVFVLVLGLLWFLALHGGVLAIVFGLVTRTRGVVSGHQARNGALLGLLTVAVALAGALALILSPGHTGLSDPEESEPPVLQFRDDTADTTGIYDSFFG